MSVPELIDIQDDISVEQREKRKHELITEDVDGQDQYFYPRLEVTPEQYTPTVPQDFHPLPEIASAQFPIDTDLLPLAQEVFRQNAKLNASCEWFQQYSAHLASENKCLKVKLQSLTAENKALALENKTLRTATLTRDNTLTPPAPPENPLETVIKKKKPPLPSLIAENKVSTGDNTPVLPAKKLKAVKRQKESLPYTIHHFKL